MLFIFGWGKRRKVWSLGDRQLIATWSFFQIFWCPIAFNIQWHLIGDSRAADVMISYDRVKELMPLGTPKVGAWSRYGLLYLVAFVVVFAFLRSA